MKNQVLEDTNGTELWYDRGMLYDKDIREPLFDFLEEEYGKVRILEEKTIGTSRADVIMITEFGVCGIEIKSDADTYVRLKSQISDYDIHFDYNYIVVGSSHAGSVTEKVPSHWGIITVEQEDEKIDFYFLRYPDRNNSVNEKEKLGLLWRPELAEMQELNQMAAYKQKSKSFVIEKIIEKVEKDKRDRQIIELLFERDYTTIFERINAFRSENQKKPKRRRRRYRKKK